MLCRKLLYKAESRAPRSTMPTNVAVPSLLEVLFSREQSTWQALVSRHSMLEGEGGGALILLPQSWATQRVVSWRGKRRDRDVGRKQRSFSHRALGIQMCIQESQSQGKDVYEWKTEWTPPGEDDWLADCWRVRTLYNIIMWSWQSQWWEIRRHLKTSSWPHGDQSLGF